MVRFRLGIHARHCNPSLAVFADGEPVFFAEEERFSRIKHSFGRFPQECLKFASKKFSIDAENCEAVCFAWDTRQYDDSTVRDHYHKLSLEFKLDSASVAWQEKNLDSFNTNHVNDYIKKQFVRSVGWIPKGRYIGYEHHLIHAYLAARDSPFEECLVLTIDGSGETDATVIWVYKDCKLKKVASAKIPHSIGWWYSAYTAFLGFQANSGEYKLMGLAAYGSITDNLDKIVRRSLQADIGALYRVDPTLISYGRHTYSSRFTDSLVKILGRQPRQSDEPIDQWHADLARSVQRHLEKIVGGIVKDAVSEYGIHNVSLAGGVAHNVKLAGSILTIPGVRDVFAHPLAGDLGTSYGAAAFQSSSNVRKSCFSVSSLYLGPEYSHSDCEKELKARGLDYELVDDLPNKLSALINEGNLVGWFQGRMEVGPRALGNRSILADPSSLAIRDRVNDVKRRERWRPLCPVVLGYRAPDYFSLTSSDPYMTLARPVTALGGQSLRGCVNEDFTTRPQVIELEDNQLLYRLLQSYEAKSGIGALLNTSFNLAGEPIVMTPGNALDCFLRSGLDYLCMHNIIVASPKSG